MCSGGALTSIDERLFYLLRQSNRYPCNQICYAKGAFKSQTLYKPNLYKWASFVHRIKYSCSIYCCTLNRCRSTNAPRCNERARKPTCNTVFICVFFLSSSSFLITHTHLQLQGKFHLTCCSNLIVEMARVKGRKINVCVERLCSLLKKRLMHGLGFVC